MPEKRAEAAPKTYVSKYKDLSLSFPIQNGGIDTMRFVNGEFTTKFVDEQEHIEGLPASHGITVKPSERATLEAKAKHLREVADAADAEAEAAEDALAALDKPKAEPKLEPKPKAEPKGKKKPEPKPKDEPAPATEPKKPDAV